MKTLNRVQKYNKNIIVHKINTKTYENFRIFQTNQKYLEYQKNIKTPLSLALKRGWATLF